MANAPAARSVDVLTSACRSVATVPLGSTGGNVLVIGAIGLEPVVRVEATEIPNEITEVKLAEDDECRAG